MKHPVIAVALSGGVDSLVSGYLLKKQYKHVFGLHFITGYEKKPVRLDQIEQQLAIPVTRIDLSREFEKKVVQYFVTTYLEGQTPNPCLICNRAIKFGVLFDRARAMGADILATGHYAAVINRVTCPGHALSGAYLEKGRDSLKDQSYFLSLLPAKRLESILFPLAAMDKNAVNQFARSHHLVPPHSSESQDICFVHDTTVPRFILEKRKMPPQSGDIVTIDGRVVGRHQGLHRFTVGQRRGINCPASEPYYVRRINMADNQLEVCFKKDLLQKQFRISRMNWNYSKTDVIPDITAKIRYSHPGAPATLFLGKNNGRVEFDIPQPAVTPGQAAVFYKGNRLLGAGIIQ